MVGDNNSIAPGLIGKVILPVCLKAGILSTLMNNRLPPGNLVTSVTETFTTEFTHRCQTESAKI